MKQNNQSTLYIFACLAVFLAISTAAIATLMAIRSSPSPTVTADIQQARDVSRQCTRSGGNAHIKTIWKGVKPDHYEITCHH